MKVKLNVSVVKAFLKEKGFSESQLSKMMGMDRSFIYRVFQGEKNPGPKFIAMLVHVTGLDFNKLFILSDDMSVDRKTEDSLKPTGTDGRS